jgi:hypothetical protein
VGGGGGGGCIETEIKRPRNIINMVQIIQIFNTKGEIPKHLLSDLVSFPRQVMQAPRSSRESPNI